MSDKKIKIVIDSLGNASVEAVGFHGQGCKDATKVIEEALARGSGDMEVTKHPEWHETEDENVVHEISTGW